MGEENVFFLKRRKILPCLLWLSSMACHIIKKKDHLKNTEFNFSDADAYLH